MKKITQRVQNLSQRAAELRAVVESVPARVVEIRDAAAAATGHVQKLRADILSSVSTLRAETDTQLITALREIDGAAEEMESAGFRLDGIDLDLGPTRRLSVHLARLHELDIAEANRAMRAAAQRPVAHALFAALIKAEELADKVELQHLHYATLQVEVGLIPSVRVGWRAEPIAATAVPVVASAPSVHPCASSPELVVPPQAFFERRGATTTPAAAGVLAGPVAEATPVVPQTRAVAPAARTGSDWRSGALDRFKKMPDLRRLDK